MNVQPGLVRLDLGLGEGLDGDDEEVVGVVSGCENHARPSLPVNRNPNPTGRHRHYMMLANVNSF